MKIRRYSFVFLAVTALFTALFLFFAYAGLANNVTIEKCSQLNMPVLSINTENGKKISKKTKYIDFTFDYFINGQINNSGKGKIRGHGNTTWRTRELYKKPYLIKFNKKQSFFTLPASKKWLLIANTSDKTSLRNKFALHLGHDIFTNQKWVPSTNFITVFINGRYEGLYGLTEKITIEPERVNLNPEDFSFLFELNTHQDRAYNFRTKENVAMSIREPDNLKKSKYKKYENKIQSFEDSLFQNNNWKSQIDMDTFIDWYLINEFTKNTDARSTSSVFYTYDALNNIISMGPVWDFDISTGNVSWNDCDNPEGWWVKNGTWFSKMFEDKEFSAKVKARWNEKKEELSKSDLWIQENADELSAAIEINDAVWKNIGHRQWPHAKGWKNRKTYQAEVDYLKGWINKRYAWMDKQFSEMN